MPNCRECVSLADFVPSTPPRQAGRYETLTPRSSTQEMTTRTWPSIDDLTNGAALGCGLCKLIGSYADLSSESLLVNSGTALAGMVELNLRMNSASSPEAIPKASLVFKTETHGRREVELELTTVDLSADQSLSCLSAPMQPHIDGVFPEAAQIWLRECRAIHLACRDHRNHRPEHLPKRLIDVKSPVANTVTIFECSSWLHDGLVSLESLGEYCTLSYAWGTTTHQCTLRGTPSATIPMTVLEMPQTFQDAIKVTRQLGFRFLWIDALCVVQDQGSEQEEEISRMGVIYRNASLTIAASLAEAAQTGFFDRCLMAMSQAPSPWPILNPRSGQGPPAPTIWILPKRYPFFYAVTESPLNNRGWVVQERALSRRILHFTKYGIYWECLSKKTNDFSGWTCLPREDHLSLIRGLGQRNCCPAVWEHFIQQYSTKAFSKPTDRLRAIAALAQAIQPRLRSGRYLAGLWRERLGRGLMWQTRSGPLRQRDALIAPTWSWASVNGSVAFNSGSIFPIGGDGYFEILDANIVPDSLHLPYGSASVGWLRIKGTIQSELLHFGENLKHFSELLCNGNIYLNKKRDIEFFWDEDPGFLKPLQPGGTSRYAECCFMPLGICSRGLFMNKSTTIAEGLILQRTQLSTAYERAIWNAGGQIPNPKVGLVFRRLGWYRETIKKLFDYMKIDLEWYHPNLLREKREAAIASPENYGHLILNCRPEEIIII